MPTTTTSTRTRAGGRPGLIAMLAHELRNPLASLQGCAFTLLDREDQLTPQQRRGLTEVIVNQSRRLDWLVGALGALGGLVGERAEADVDLGRAAREAGSLAGLSVEAPGPLPVRADERRLRLALEALFVALSQGARARAALTRDGGLEVWSTARDLAHGGRRWKLDLARRLLREEGLHLRLRRCGGGTRARVRLERAGLQRSRRIA